MSTSTSCFTDNMNYVKATYLVLFQHLKWAIRRVIFSTWWVLKESACWLEPILLKSIFTGRFGGKAVIVWSGSKSLWNFWGEKTPAGVFTVPKHGGDPWCYYALTEYFNKTFFSGRQKQSCWAPLQDNLQPYTSQIPTHCYENTNIHIKQHIPKFWLNKVEKAAGWGGGGQYSSSHEKEKVPMAIPKEIFSRSTLVILTGTKIFNNVSNSVGNY